MGTRLVTTTTIGACDLRFHVSPCPDIAPSCVAWVLALLQPYSRRSPAHHRPDVSVSWTLPQALASSGILLPSGIRLAPTLEFISLSFWYDAPLTSQDSDRRHDSWLVYGSPICSLAPQSSWISPA